MKSLLLVFHLFLSVVLCNEIPLSKDKKDALVAETINLIKNEGKPNADFFKSLGKKENLLSFGKKLNELLGQQGLPIMDLASGKLYVKPVIQTGYSYAEVVGVEISDGNTVLCVNCLIEGVTKIGLFPVKKTAKPTPSLMACYNAIKDYNEKVIYSAELNAMLFPCVVSDKNGMYLFSGGNESNFIAFPEPAHDKMGTSVSIYYFELDCVGQSGRFLTVSITNVVPKKINFSVQATPGSKKYTKAECKNLYDDQFEKALAGVFNETLDEVFDAFSEEPNLRAVFLDKLQPCKGITEVQPEAVKEKIDQIYKKIENEEASSSGAGPNGKIK